VPGTPDSINDAILHPDQEAIMSINRFSVLAAALTGCAVAASAYVFRGRARRRKALQLSKDLSTWEGEGGQTAPPAVHPIKNI
jgi:energy-converting hydrogenase Eha subunit G